MPLLINPLRSTGASDSGNSANSPSRAACLRIARTGESGWAIHSSNRAIAPASPVGVVGRPSVKFIFRPFFASLAKKVGQVPDLAFAKKELRRRKQFTAACE